MTSLPLHLLNKNEAGRIASIHADEAAKHRLHALGFLEGLHVRVLHEAPLGRDPIAVDLGGHVIALRRSDAATIMVEAAE